MDQSPHQLEKARKKEILKGVTIIEGDKKIRKKKNILKGVTILEGERKEKEKKRTKRDAQGRYHH